MLDDRGCGDAPAEYLAAIEHGLRQYASDLYAMGSNALASREKWFSIAVWRKRETYIALVRAIYGLKPPRRFMATRWEDYSKRQVLAETFMARHANLRDFPQQHLKDPKHWDKPEPATDGGSSDPDGGELVPMRFDVATGSLVPYS